MRTPHARLLIGATLLVAGFGVMTDGAPLRLMDFKDRECRTASVAVGSACPAGCEARPVSAPADRARPTSCRSRLWVATCGTACAPASGYVRLPDGALADARRLILAASAAPTSDFERLLVDLRVTAEPRFDGLFRYDIVLPEGADMDDLEETKKRLSALPGVLSVDHLLR
jgi:hypothetical protein